VNATASSNYQPKGDSEGRAAHVTAKATDRVGNPSNAKRHTPTLDLCGVWGVGTFRQGSVEQGRAVLVAESGKDVIYKAGG